MVDKVWFTTQLIDPAREDIKVWFAKQLVGLADTDPGDAEPAAKDPEPTDDDFLCMTLYACHNLDCPRRKPRMRPEHCYTCGKMMEQVI